MICTAAAWLLRRLGASHHAKIASHRKTQHSGILISLNFTQEWNAYFDALEVWIWKQLSETTSSWHWEQPFCWIIYILLKPSQIPRGAKKVKLPTSISTLILFDPAHSTKFAPSSFGMETQPPYTRSENSHELSFRTIILWEYDDDGDDDDDDDVSGVDDDMVDEVVFEVSLTLVTWHFVMKSQRRKRMPGLPQEWFWGEASHKSGKNQQTDSLVRFPPQINVKCKEGPSPPKWVKK